MFKNTTKRLKRGEFKRMSLQEQRAWRCVLNARWRKRHPETVRAKNSYYAKKYLAEKPYDCMCVKCGATFNAYRRSFKWCPNCIEKLHKNARNRRMREQEKRDLRKDMYAKVVKLSKTKMTQAEIAKIVGITQRGVSAIMMRNKIYRKPNKNRLTRKRQNATNS